MKRRNRGSEEDPKYDIIFREHPKNRKPAARAWINDHKLKLQELLLTDKPSVMLSYKELPQHYTIWRHIGEMLVKSEDIKAYTVKKKSGLILILK